MSLSLLALMSPATVQTDSLHKTSSEAAEINMTTAKSEAEFRTKLHQAAYSAIKELMRMMK